MKIVAINGSPKKTKNTSAKIIKEIEEILCMDIKVIKALDLVGESDSNQKILSKQIIEADVLLIVCPLYVDALPSPVVRAMQIIEKESKESDLLPRAYGISQCGFFEATHNKIALKIMQNFCSKVGIHWQYGIGIGAGVFLGETKQINSGPTKAVYNELEKLCKDIKNDLREVRENSYISPSMLRILYKLGGNIQWKSQAKKNNVYDKLHDKPFIY
ncbi:MAG: NAD(P)H-dependent oxidoreductase [Tissierellia bacterium]|nr:NAD(P)H-dependent oxidoreductase [Tissierellia bacterium]